MRRDYLQRLVGVAGPEVGIPPTSVAAADYWATRIIATHLTSLPWQHEPICPFGDAVCLPSWYSTGYFFCCCCCCCCYSLCVFQPLRYLCSCRRTAASLKQPPRYRIQYLLRWVTSVCSDVMILPKTTPKAVFMEHIIVSKELSFIQSGESICFFFFLNFLFFIWGFTYFSDSKLRTFYRHTKYL